MFPSCRLVVGLWKGKIAVGALTGCTHTSIGKRSVPVLAFDVPYQYWETYKNARTGIGTSNKKKNSSMGIE